MSDDESKLHDMKSIKDNKSFEKIYSDYVKPVYYCAYAILNNREQAEDITQDVFVKWYEELVEMFGSDKFACKSAKYNYVELINAMSDMSSKENVANIVGYGINDYLNKIDVDVKSEEDVLKLKKILADDMFNYTIVGDVIY